jgi:hypothetical protein
MNTPTYHQSISALLVVDPYNDFISEGGKIWPRIKAVAEANDCVSNMLKVLNAARAAKLRVFYAMHHRYRAGDYETWTYIAPIQRATWLHKTFEYGTWGGEFRAEFVPAPGEIVAQEHWCSSGFANTDLDLQRQRHRRNQGNHRLNLFALSVCRRFTLVSPIGPIADMTIRDSDVLLRGYLMSSCGGRSGHSAEFLQVTRVGRRAPYLLRPKSRHSGIRAC